jgi:hypothetical protein
MWMKLFMSVLCAVSIISFLYLGIIPFPIYPEYLQFVAIVSLIAAVVIPLSGMLESEFMKGEDNTDEVGPQAPYHRPAETIRIE